MITACKSRDLARRAGMPVSNLISSLAHEMITERTEQGQIGILLASDIDGTLETVFSQEVIGPGKLLAELDQKSIPTAYVTGNSIDVVLDRIKQSQLPAASIIISAVGTEIWFKANSDPSDLKYIQDEVYSQMLKGRYYRRFIVEDAFKFVDDLYEADLKADGDIYNLVLQKAEEEKQFLRDGTTPEGQSFKVSFTFFASRDEMLKRVQEDALIRFPGQRVIICEELNHNSQMSPTDKRKKYNLDVLPVTKAEAVNYVSAALGADCTIVAGDSGNDFEMLTESGDVAIIVGNARPELRNPIRNMFSKWEKGLYHKTKERGRSKIYVDDTGTNRVGPESIEHAMRVLDRATQLI